MAIKFTDSELKALGIENRPYIDSPITSTDPFHPSNADRFSLSAHFVKITCGVYNADVACNIAGKKGTGKSYGSLEIGRMCAIRISDALNNDGGSAWNDYFDVERNIAVMDADKLIDILTRRDKHQVIIGDDVGTIIGARQYRKEENQLMNNVFVVNRTQNNIYLSSAPETKHVDRQARDLPEHQLDFQKNEALFSVGLSMCKYFHKITDPKTSVSYHAYTYWKDMQVARILIPKPPKKMIEEYDKLREIGAEKIKRALSDAMTKNKKENDIPKTPIPAPSEILKKSRQEKINTAQSMMYQYRDTDYTQQKKCILIARALGVSPYTIKSWLDIGKICK